MAGSEGIEWPFQISGNAAESLKAIDDLLDTLPKNLEDVEAELKKLDRAAEAVKVTRITDPMKQNQAILKMHAAQLRDAAKAAEDLEDAEGKGKKKKGDDETVKGGIAKGLGLGDMAKLGTAAGIAEKGTEMVIDALKEAVSVAKDLAVEFVKTGIESSEAYKQQIGSLRGLEGEAAKQTVDALDDMANAAGRDGDAALEAFKNLRNAGLDTAETMDVLAASSDLKWQTGGNEAAAKSFEDVFAKIRTLGKVGTKDLAALRDSGIELPKLAEALGGRIGKSADQAMKLLQKGDAKSIDVQNALLDVVQNQNADGGLGSLAKTASLDNVNAQLGVLKDAAGDLFKDVDASPIAHALGNISELLNGDLGQRLKDVFNKTFAFIGTELNTIDFGRWIDKGTSAVESLSTGFDAFWAGLQPAIGGIETLETTLDVVNESMGGAETNTSLWKVLGYVVGSVAVAFMIVVDVVRLLFDALAAVVGLIADGIGGAVDWVKDLFGVGEDGAKGMADGLRAGQPDVAKAAAEMAGSVPDAARTELDIHSPSRVMAGVAHNTIDGFELPFEQRDPAALLDFGSGISVPSFDSGNLNGRGAGGFELHISVTVMGGSDPEDTGARIGRAIARSSDLVALLEQLKAA